MKKIFLILIVGLFFLPIVPAHAIDVNGLTPEFNPICWEHDACMEVRKSFNRDASQKELEAGWLKGEAPCDKEGWGKCLPAGIINTEIKFGGQTQFKDLGQFLVTNYNFALSIAGILAVIMIIIAGAQWVTSGGNSEAIGSAKKRIGGAMIGLLIAYMSYVILNTINPATVNLRLPQTFMVRTNKVVPEFCSDAPVASMFALAAEENKTVDPKALEKASFDIPYNKDAFTCGRRFFIKEKDGGSGTATCGGNICKNTAGNIDPGRVCSPVKIIGYDVKPLEQYNCITGQLIVHYRLTALMESIKQYIPYASDLVEDWLYTKGGANISLSAPAVFWGVCKNSSGSGDLKIANGYHTWGDIGRKQRKVVSFEKNGMTEYYFVFGGMATAVDSPSDADYWYCQPGYKLVGFALRNIMDKNRSTEAMNFFVGVSPSGGAVVGKWSSVGINNYIPVDKLVNGGLFLNADVSDGVLKDIVKNHDEEPKKNGSGEID